MTGNSRSGGYFFREVKRRRVLRTCLYYVIACWLILQVGDIVYPAVGLDDDKASRLFLYIAIIGFPVNFALAWYFQITPRGIVRTTSFVERRVLKNIPPINDRRHGGVSTYFQKDEESDSSWIISAETGPLSGLSFAVTGPVVIGRSLDCDLAVVTPHVSRRHAELDVEDYQLYVRDLGSANGTVVNGRPIEGRHALRHEDELRLHDIIFRVTESFSGPRQERDSMNQTTFIDNTLSGGKSSDSPED